MKRHFEVMFIRRLSVPIDLEIGDMTEADQGARAVQLARETLAELDDKAWLEYGEPYRLFAEELPEKKA